MPNLRAIITVIDDKNNSATKAFDVCVPDLMQGALHQFDSGGVDNSCLGAVELIHCSCDELGKISLS